MKHLNKKLNLFFENKEYWTNGGERRFHPRNNDYILIKLIDEVAYFTFMTEVEHETHIEIVAIMVYDFDLNSSNIELGRTLRSMDTFAIENGFSFALKNIRKELNKKYNTFKNEEANKKNYSKRATSFLEELEKEPDYKKLINILVES